MLVRRKIVVNEYYIRKTKVPFGAISNRNDYQLMSFFRVIKNLMNFILFLAVLTKSKSIM